MVALEVRTAPLALVIVKLTAALASGAPPAVTEAVVKSIGEGIHFYKTEKVKTSAILKKYMKIDGAEDLQASYSFYVKPLNEKPYPSIKGIQTFLDWSKRAEARKAKPAQFINAAIVERLDRQGFIDALYRK